VQALGVAGGLAAGDELVEASGPAMQLHGEEEAAVGVAAELVDRCDVGVLELAGDLGLADEAVDEQVVAVGAVVQDLGGHPALQGGVEGDAHGTDAAGGDLVAEAQAVHERGQDGVDERRVRGSRRSGRLTPRIVVSGMSYSSSAMAQGGHGITDTGRRVRALPQRQGCVRSYNCDICHYWANDNIVSLHMWTSAERRRRRRVCAGDRNMHTFGSSSCRKLRGFSAALGLLAYSGCYGSATPEDGCQVDLDCKGDRICVDSLCVDPDMAGTAGSGDPTDGVGGVDPVDPGDDVVEGEYPQALPSECSEGAKDYAAKTPADFCPISLVVLVDDGGGGDPVMTEAEVMDEIAFVNTYFADSALSFSVVEVKYYNHDIVLDPDQPKITELNDNDIVAALGKDHIVLAIIDPNKSEYCGRGNLGGTTPTPAAFVVSNCTSLYASTAMVHELGHTLGLPHPFAPFNPLADMPDPALIPGLDDDCYVTGDRMCDTPPDPTKKYCPLVDCEAVCEGDFEAYEPEAGLTMSYYDDECQSPTTAFSQEQKNVMRCVVDKVLPQLGNCEDCAPADYTQCSAGDLYYFDSCNKIGALAQSCDDGNTCTDDSCGGQPVPERSGGQRE
jgi:hypothetical protein